MKHDYKDEYQNQKTINGFTEDEVIKSEDWLLKLMLKNIKGKASLIEIVAIEIELFLAYNNVTHILESDILKQAADINALINEEQW